MGRKCTHSTTVCPLDRTHKGFETLTFVFDGEVAHSDSTGQTFVTGPSGVQWMTAGRGIEHEEVSPESFKEHGGPLEIIQVWMNLPARLKRSEPWYCGYESEELLHVHGPSWVWHIVSGEVEGQRGPAESVTGLFMSWLDLQSGAQFSEQVPAGRGLMLYVVRGEVVVNGSPVRRRTMVELGTNGPKCGARPKAKTPSCCSAMARVAGAQVTDPSS